MYWKGKRLVAGMLVRIGQNKMNQVNKMKHRGVGVSRGEREGHEGPTRQNKRDATQRVSERTDAWEAGNSDIYGMFISYREPC